MTYSGVGTVAGEFFFNEVTQITHAQMALLSNDISGNSFATEDL